MSSIDQLNQLLDQAQELEEKGDRYVDGEKAKRFYIRSCELYSLANDIESDLPQVLENWARILFILAEFKDPLTCHDQACIWLKRSTEMYLKLASIEPENDDVLFNIAQTMHSHVIVSKSGFYKLNEAIWYLDQIRGIEKDSSDTLILRIEIMNSIMEYSHEINQINQVFMAATDLYTDDREVKVILRIAESCHVFGFRLFDLNASFDSSVFSKAVELIEIVLSREPNNIEALCDKSDLYISWADLVNDSSSAALYSQALESLSEASKLDPRNTDILTRLGDIHLSRLKYYSNINTKVLCAKNAKLYYQNVLSKPQMWTLFHFVKASTWISSDYSDKAWDMLLKMANDHHLSLDEWIKSSDVLDVPFGPFNRYNI